MAITAISYIRPQKARQYPQIVNQLKQLATSASDPRLRKMTKQVVEMFGL